MTRYRSRVIHYRRVISHQRFDLIDVMVPGGHDDFERLFIPRQAVGTVIHVAHRFTKNTKHRLLLRSFGTMDQYYRNCII